MGLCYSTCCIVLLMVRLKMGQKVATPRSEDAECKGGVECQMNGWKSQPTTFQQALVRCFPEVFGWEEPRTLQVNLNNI